MLSALYPTKKALKDAIGQPLKHQETCFHKDEYKATGVFAVVGPSPTNRKWFADVTMLNGKIASVV